LPRGRRYPFRSSPFRGGNAAHWVEEELENVFRKFVGTFAIVVALATALGGARAKAVSQDARAQELLAKHRSYVGWQFGDGTFRTMRISGSVTNENGEKEMTFVQLWSGLLYRSTNTYVKQEVGEQEGFTGNLFWRADLNQFTTPVYGDYAKFLASLSVLRQEGTSALPATFLRDGTMGGKPVGVVRVTLANGDAIDLEVDSATGAYLQATIDPGGSYQTSYRILSYRDIRPGKKIADSYRIVGSKSTTAYSSIEPNLEVSNADLHPPAPRASWTFEGVDSFPIELTHNRILINATVNGIEGRFILDTGAYAIVLDEGFAERAKVPAKGNGEASTLRGPVPTRVRPVRSIAFGGSTLHDVLVYSEDFRNHDYRGLDRRGYDGLIGYDLFAGAIVKLDVYASKMTILDPSSDLSTIRGLPLTVDLSRNVPAIPMTLNKTAVVNALLDTGNPGVVLLPSDVIRRYQIKMMQYRGCGNLDTLTIGPITYTSQLACTWNAGGDYALLGYDFLKHFNYVFDYPHGRMFMEPNKN
jgi:hypothetical protein